jgi:hypothetical protein
VFVGGGGIEYHPTHVVLEAFKSHVHRGRCYIEAALCVKVKHFFRELMSIFLLLLGTHSDVVNFTFREAVIINPSLSTNMTSSASVLSSLRSKIYLGISTYSARTGSWVARTVFPLSGAMLGLDIVLAALMDPGVTGQFHIMFELTIFLKSLSELYPTIPNDMHAYLAALKARLV